MTHNTPQKPTAPDIHRIEFFRQGIALLPDTFDKRPGVAFFLQPFRNICPISTHLPSIPLKSIFKVSRNTELDLEIRPQIQLIQENGEEKFFENKDLEKFTYGPLVYIKEMGIMAQLEMPGKFRKFKAPVKIVLKKSQVPVFLEEDEEDLTDGPFTEGTLEEKIAAIISKKRNLMDSVIEESDPTVMKSFTREELIDLLAIPQLESSEVF